MPRRTWDAKANAFTVLEGLQGKSVAEICTAHPISQSRSDQWRDQFLAHAANAVDNPPRTRTEVRLGEEHTRLQPLVGELTVE